MSHVDDRSLGLHRDVYGEARTEKDARAAVYSAIKRVLGRDEIVVADGMNYVKGFRYQLYCEAKAVQTTSCVVNFFFLSLFLILFFVAPPFFFRE